MDALDPYLALLGRIRALTEQYVEATHHYQDQGLTAKDVQVIKEMRWYYMQVLQMHAKAKRKPNKLTEAIYLGLRQCNRLLRGET